MLLESQNSEHNGARDIRTPNLARASRCWRHIAFVLLLNACDDDASSGTDAGAPVQMSDARVQAVSNDAAVPVGPGGASGGGGLGAGAFDAGAMAPGGNEAGPGSVSNPDGSSAPAPTDAGGDSGAPVASGACTRDSLRALVDQYFTAFAAHDSSMLPLAANAKYTENGKMVAIGEGAWKTAGAAKFKRTLVDTQICTAVVEAVFDNAYSGESGGSGLLGGLFGGGGGGSTGGSGGSAGRADFVYGLRLKVDAGKITEIETILVGPDGWFPNPQAVLDGAKDDWETPLPADQRATRDDLKKIVDDYFELFETGDVASFPFSSNCTRLENGFSPGACDFGIIAFGSMTPRLYVLDEEASIAIGFVMFAGSFTDFHMFKVRDKQVVGVKAVLASSSSGSGWD